MPEHDLSMALLDEVTRTDLPRWRHCVLRWRIKRRLAQERRERLRLKYGRWRDDGEAVIAAAWVVMAFGGWLAITIGEQCNG